MKAARGYYWFLAWRYLTAQGRISRAILAGAGLLLALAALFIGLGWLFAGMPPLGDVLLAMNVWTIAAAVCVFLAALSPLLLLIRALFSFSATVSTTGVAVGTLALVFSLSVMNGFERDLRSKILGSHAHVRVTKKRPPGVSKQQAPFVEYRDVQARIAKIAGVHAVTPYLQAEVLLKPEGERNGATILLKGIEPVSANDVIKLAQHIQTPGISDTDRAARALAQAQTMLALWPLGDDFEPVGPQPDKDDALIVDPGQAYEPLDLSGGATGPDGPSEPSRNSDGGVLPRNGDLGDPVDNLAKPIDIDKSIDDIGKPLTHTITLSDPGLFSLTPFSAIARRPGMIVGAELAKNLTLQPRNLVFVVSPSGAAGPSVKPAITGYRVAGSFYTGMYEYDLRLAYVELSALQTFLDVGDQVDGVEIRVSDSRDTDTVRRRIEKALGDGYVVEDWQILNSGLFSALKLEKIAMFLVLAIIILVASFSIVGSLITVVVEKAKEIALLKTLGADDRSIVAAYVAQGLFIGVVGTFIGGTLGVSAALAVEHFGFPLPPEVYYIDRLPIFVDPWSVVTVIGAGLSISVAATVYPAWLAARLRPVEGLRHL